jgi:hypothetical protein
VVAWYGIVGGGQIKHTEFAMASGELSRPGAAASDRGVARA